MLRLLGAIEMDRNSDAFKKLFVQQVKSFSKTLFRSTKMSRLPNLELKIQILQIVVISESKNIPMYLLFITNCFSKFLNRGIFKKIFWDSNFKSDFFKKNFCNKNFF